MTAGMQLAHVEGRESAARQSAARRRRPFHLEPIRAESLALACVLAAGGALRLALAARGWPYVNSDEATTGLMAYDILHRGAHPAFTYGIHHVGALGAYLAALVFLVLGPTNLALHVATTLQTLAFLLALYLLARAIFSRGVALASVALLALGPEQTLAWTLRTGHYAQDVPLFGALLLWLVVLRLSQPLTHGRRLALDAGIGLVAGLGLWCTPLFVPFVLAAGLALGLTAWRRGMWRRGLPHAVSVAAAGGLMGLAPFLVVTVTSRGAVLREALAASGAAGSGTPPGLLGALAGLGQQIAATLLFGLPSMFGSRTVCPGCPIWPSPQSHPSAGDALRGALVGAAFAALVVGSWLAVALPLIRDVRATWAARRRGGLGDPAGRDTFDARWWGRAMVVVASGLTVVQYALARSSYANADTAPRYLVGVWVGVPLIAAPLVGGARRVWRWARGWARARAAGESHAATSAAPGRALFTAVLLAALVAVGGVGAVAARAATADRDRYGVPAGERDLRLIGFLETHGATRFSTTWWVCHRLMFDSAERLTCAVVNDRDASKPGFNAMPAYAAEVAAAPHPAYVFDLTTTEVDPSVPRDLAARIAAGDPRFAGYISATVAGYAVFYHPVAAR